MPFPREETTPPVTKTNLVMKNPRKLTRLTETPDGMTSYQIRPEPSMKRMKMHPLTHVIIGLFRKVVTNRTKPFIFSGN